MRLDTRRPADVMPDGCGSRLFLLFRTIPCTFATIIVL